MANLLVVFNAANKPQTARRFVPAQNTPNDDLKVAFTPWMTVSNVAAIKADSRQRL
jgi:hypothetical protein